MNLHSYSALRCTLSLYKDHHSYGTSVGGRCLALDVLRYRYCMTLYEVTNGLTIGYAGDHCPQGLQ